MKKLKIEQLIPGNEEYDKVQPLRPTNVLFSHSYIFFIFRDSVAVWKRQKMDSSLTTIFFDDWIVQNTRRIYYETLASGEFKAHQPKLYHVEELECDRLRLRFTEESVFFEIELTYSDGSVVFRYFREEKVDIHYPRSNDQGELAYSTSCNYLRLWNGESEKMLHSEHNASYRLDRLPSRSEFGITELVHWSPDNRRVAFYMNNDNQVEEYPLVRIMEPMARLEKIKYPMAGRASENVRIGVLDLETSNIAFIDPGKCYLPQDNRRRVPCNYDYLTSLTWSEDSEHLYLCHLSRSQQYFFAEQHSATTGEFETLLFEETSDRYVEPEHPFYPQGNNLYFLSQRTGHQHIYRCDLTTHAVVAVTSGEWDVLEIISVNASFIYYYSTERSPLNREVYRLNLTDGGREPLWSFDGRQEVFFNNEKREDEQWVMYMHNREVPGIVVIDGHEFPVRNPLEKYQSVRQTVGYFEKEGTKIYYKVTEPFVRKNAEGKKRRKSPVVFYVYGGPHVQLVQNGWGSGTKGFEEMMAQAGYYVFYIDPHGSAHRGRDFESVIYQRINQPQLEDYDYALDWFFENYGEVADKNRMAIYGWSFGGYMTLSMLLKSRYTFQFGVAGGAVVDWRYYEVMYTERYMGIYNSSTEKYYEECDIKRDWGRLRTPVYLIHCDNDPVVLWQHTLSLLKKSNQECGNCHLVDYYVFPGHPHNVRGKERIQLMNKIKLLIDRKIK